MLDAHHLAVIGPALDGLIDTGMVQRLFEGLVAIAPVWVYIAVGLGAAIENLFPPIPADTFVLFGAFLSTQGRVTGLGVFLATWSMNTAGACLNYGIARRWGRRVLSTRLGRWLLRPRQLEKLAALYNAHGSKIIFVSRFLPAFRALVPTFAGISRLPVWRTVLPLALASGIWYGVLVYAAIVFGRNLPAIREAFRNVNTLLLVMAGILAVLVIVAWRRTRGSPHEEPDERGA